MSSEGMPTFADGQQHPNWPKLFRIYLARREERALAAAVACAPPDVAEYLILVGKGDIQAIKGRIEQFRQQQNWTRQEFLTLELACCDVFARLCEASRGYPIEQRDQVLAVGLFGSFCLACSGNASLDGLNGLPAPFRRHSGIPRLPPLRFVQPSANAPLA